METALNKSLHDATLFLFDYLNDHHMTEEKSVGDDTTSPATVAKRQKLSNIIALETKQIALRKGHFYVNNK